MTFQEYRDYLRSPTWWAKAIAAKARANWRCQVCECEGPLEAHHITYARLGHETAGDILVLCEACHMEIHGRREARQLSLFRPTPPTGAELN